MAVPLRGGSGGKGHAVKEERAFFLYGEVPTDIKLEGGGGSRLRP